MSHTITIEVSDEVYNELVNQAKPSDMTVEAIAAKWMEEGLEELNADPLIRASGSLHVCVEDDTEYIDSLPPATFEIQNPDETDPVLRLLGAIQSPLTDVGKRHDYYIGQGLLKEMRRNA